MTLVAAHDASTARRTQRGTDSYDGIEPLLEQLAAMAEDDRGRPALREQILRRCLPLADHIARRFTGRGETYDDLHQSASIGLILAVDRFDPARGSSFLAFAVPTIMGEVRRHFRDRTWAVRVPRRVKETQLALGPVIERLCQRDGRMPTAIEIAVEMNVDLLEVTQALMAGNAYRTNSLDASADDEEGSVAAQVAETLGDLDPAYDITDDALAVAPLLRDLSERDRRILHLRFFENCTQSQIARELGVSQMHISRILTRTLATLRERALRD
ncbi:SigB/SigF/SigG family RNA polymerase sigma factor [Nocardia jiangsuensis]|uniref:SigB/SigF/SigG family RNA polymerase sigma factor n=1 Tax=Nocardia jiangsuensis TaxID=1691563 RepID=A0ABV8DS26_9NOCA